MNSVNELIVFISTFSFSSIVSTGLLVPALWPNPNSATGSNANPVIAPPEPSFRTRASVNPASLPPVDTSVFENDIDQSFEQEKLARGRVGDARSGVVGNQFRWPADINFQISTAFSQSEYNTIYAALRTLAGALSGCRVIGVWPQTASPRGDYVFITNEGPGCSSIVGRRGGRQVLNLGWGCVHQGIALHEMIHAIGFHHEQIRPDRDSFVNVHWGNVQPGTEFNFRTSPQYSLTYGIPYDFYSIMHYGEHDFSINGGKTVEAKNAGIVVGSRGIMTELDRRRLRAMHSCP